MLVSGVVELTSNGPAWIGCTTRARGTRGPASCLAGCEKSYYVSTVLINRGWGAAELTRATRRRWSVSVRSWSSSIFFPTAPDSALRDESRRDRDHDHDHDLTILP